MPRRQTLSDFWQSLDIAHKGRDQPAAPCRRSLQEPARRSSSARNLNEPVRPRSSRQEPARPSSARVARGRAPASDLKRNKSFQELENHRERSPKWAELHGSASRELTPDFGQGASEVKECPSQCSNPASGFYDGSSAGGSPWSSCGPSPGVTKNTFNADELTDSAAQEELRVGSTAEEDLWMSPSKLTALAQLSIQRSSSSASGQEFDKLTRVADPLQPELEKLTRIADPLQQELEKPVPNCEALPTFDACGVSEESTLKLKLQPDPQQRSSASRPDCESKPRSASSWPHAAAGEGTSHRKRKGLSSGRGVMKAQPPAPQGSSAREGPSPSQEFLPTGLSGSLSTKTCGKHPEPRSHDGTADCNEAIEADSDALEASTPRHLDYLGDTPRSSRGSEVPKCEVVKQPEVQKSTESMSKAVIPKSEMFLRIEEKTGLVLEEDARDLISRKIQEFGKVAEERVQRRTRELRRNSQNPFHSQNDQPQRHQSTVDTATPGAACSDFKDVAYSKNDEDVLKHAEVCDGTQTAAEKKKKERSKLVKQALKDASNRTVSSSSAMTEDVSDRAVSSSKVLPEEAAGASSTNVGATQESKLQQLRRARKELGSELWQKRKERSKACRASTSKPDSTDATDESKLGQATTAKPRRLRRFTVAGHAQKTAVELAESLHPSPCSDSRASVAQIADSTKHFQEGECERFEGQILDPTKHFHKGEGESSELSNKTSESESELESEQEQPRQQVEQRDNTAFFQQGEAGTNSSICEQVMHECEEHRSEKAVRGEVISEPLKPHSWPSQELERLGQAPSVRPQPPAVPPPPFLDPPPKMMRSFAHESRDVNFNSWKENLPYEKVKLLENFDCTVTFDGVSTGSRTSFKIDDLSSNERKESLEAGTAFPASQGVLNVDDLILKGKKGFGGSNSKARRESGKLEEPCPEVSTPRELLDDCLEEIGTTDKEVRRFFSPAAVQPEVEPEAADKDVRAPMHRRQDAFLSDAANCNAVSDAQTRTFAIGDVFEDLQDAHARPSHLQKQSLSCALTEMAAAVAEMQGRVEHEPSHESSSSGVPSSLSVHPILPRMNINTMRPQENLLSSSLSGGDAGVLRESPAFQNEEKGMSTPSRRRSLNSLNEKIAFSSCDAELSGTRMQQRRMSAPAAGLPDAAKVCPQQAHAPEQAAQEIRASTDRLLDFLAQARQGPSPKTTPRKDVSPKTTPRKSLRLEVAPQPEAQKVRSSLQQSGVSRTATQRTSTHIDATAARRPSLYDFRDNQPPVKPAEEKKPCRTSLYDFRNEGKILRDDPTEIDNSQTHRKSVTSALGARNKDKECSSSKIECALCGKSETRTAEEAAVNSVFCSGCARRLSLLDAPTPVPRDSPTINEATSNPSASHIPATAHTADTSSLETCLICSAKFSCDNQADGNALCPQCAAPDNSSFERAVLGDALEL